MQTRPIPVWTALYVAGAIFGSGFALCLGIAISLAVKVLPGTISAGKVPAIIYTSILIPLKLTLIIGSEHPERFSLLWSLFPHGSCLQHSGCCAYPAHEKLANRGQVQRVLHACRTCIALQLAFGVASKGELWAKRYRFQRADILAILNGDRH